MSAALTKDLQRVLIVLPSWVGDTVMATPVFRAVRAALPTARLIGAARPGLKDLLAGTRWFDAWIETPKGGILQPFSVSRHIRAHRPDAALLLPNSFRAALTVRLAGTPIRCGYARDGRGWLLTHPRGPVDVIRSSRPMPTLDYYALLAEAALGLDSIDRKMELSVTDPESQAADALLAGVGEPFIVLNPGANKVEKRWPADRFAAVANALHESNGITVTVTGSPGERKVIGEIISAAQSPMIDLAARGVTLASLKAVIRRAALLITNDTGPRHIAAALGTPVVTLFGPTDHRWTTINFDRERIILAEPFLSEDLIADQHPALCSIERIPISDVVAAARQLLAGASSQVTPTAAPSRSAP